MDESLERLRLRIRLTEMMIEKRERAYQESMRSGSELQRKMRLKKLCEEQNNLARLKATEDKLMKEGDANAS